MYNGECNGETYIEGGLTKVTAGNEGELVAKGPNIFSGYFKVLPGQSGKIDCG
jgi:hypothetical protein